MLSFAYRALGLGIIAFACCGCGGPNGQPVSGKVTYKNKPIVKGSVTFTPVEKGGAPITVSIEDGAFSAPALNGPPPGNYILKFDAVQRLIYGSSVPGEAAPPPKDLDQEMLPEKYKSASTYKVEVVAGKPNEFDIKLD